jgi:heme exporter protein D
MFSFQKFNRMLVVNLLSFGWCTGYFLINRTFSGSLNLDTNDDAFFSIVLPFALFVVHSGLDNVIASINIYSGPSPTHFGYLGRETRSFGVSFGPVLGSISIFCRNKTTFSFTVTLLPHNCSSMLLSLASTDCFSINPEDSLHPFTVSCYCYISRGEAFVEINFTSMQKQSTLYVQHNNDDTRTFDSTVALSEIIEGPLVVTLDRHEGIDQVSLIISIRPLSYVSPEKEYRVSLAPNKGSQLLIDETIVWPAQIPPVLPRIELEPGELPIEVGLIVMFFDICICCMLVIIVALLIVAIKKRQRKLREIERERNQNTRIDERRHISTASCSVPRIDVLASTAQLVQELLAVQQTDI